MNRKVNLSEEINRINAIIENSKRINEGLYLDDKYTPEPDDTYEETPHELQGGEAVPSEEDNRSIAEKSEYVDTIRKMALKGMTALADDPDSVEYQNLKKIFSLCDKKPTNNQNNQAV